MVGWDMAVSKFRSCESDQVYLLPPSLNEWFPQDHLVYFITYVVKELDLREINIAWLTPGGLSA